MIIEQFRCQAQAVGAECRQAAGRQEAIEAILSILQEEGVRDEAGYRAVWAQNSWLTGEERQEIIQRVPGLQFDVTRVAAEQAMIGVTEMDWGVAQTGTLLSDSTPADRRLASTLPPIHIAVLPVSRIVADIGTAFTQLDVCRCAFVSAITGPSRTADIERVLTIGVHGPRRLVILLVQDLVEAGASA
jgi:L-lactate dehydrogenase complex protein LldG